MKILGIDPGPKQSAMVRIVDGKIWPISIMANPECLGWFEVGEPYDLIACEWISSYGMPVGAEVFNTARWVGRFEQQCVQLGLEFQLITRHAVKLHICQSARAKDANIRRALLDRFGEPGTKKAPGATYGMHSHLWSALAVAVAALDQQGKGAPY